MLNTSSNTPAQPLRLKPLCPALDDNPRKEGYREAKNSNLEDSEDQTTGEIGHEWVGTQRGNEKEFKTQHGCPGCTETKIPLPDPPCTPPSAPAYHSMIVPLCGAEQ